MRSLGLVTMSMIACSGDSRPTQHEQPTKAQPVAQRAAPGTSSAKCDEAIAVWVSIPPTGSFNAAAVNKAWYQLSNRDVFENCNNAALETVVPVAIGALDDKRVVSDSRGGDGSLYLLRNAAKSILERLTGKRFGELYIDHNGMTQHGVAPDTQEDPKAVPGWRGWWADARGDLRQVIAEGRAATDGVNAGENAVAASRLAKFKLHAYSVATVNAAGAGWTRKDGVLFQESYQKQVVDHFAEADYPEANVMRWPYHAVLPLANLANGDAPLPPAMLADIAKQEPALYTHLLRMFHLEMWALDGDTIARVTLRE